jgi:hypothetical protein
MGALAYSMTASFTPHSLLIFDLYDVDIEQRRNSAASTRPGNH